MRRFDAASEPPHRDDARRFIPPNGRAARGQALVEHETAMVLELAKLSGQMTDLAQWFKGGAVNDVLFSATVAIPTGGVYTKDFTVPFGCIAVQNLSPTNPMTLMMGGQATANTTQTGEGTHLIKPGAAAVINMADRVFALYGTAADQANVQVFASPRPPAYQQTLGLTAPSVVTGAQTPGDAVANPTDAVDNRAFVEVWDADAATWERWATGPVTGAPLVDQFITGTYPASPTNVPAANADTALLAANAARRGLIVSNDSTAKLYVLFDGSGAGAASAANFTYVVPAGGTLELNPLPAFTGRVRGFWSAANGSAGVTEIT
jgi:hypothetical protein